MFRVRLEGQQYVIKSYDMTHNHPCTSSWMVCDPLSRRLSSEEKENLKPVILHCQSTDEVIESIKERTGWTRKQVLQMMRQNGQVREHAENGSVTAVCFSSYDQIQCNCSTFNMCRYPCRHLLLAYIKRRSLTAHQLLRCCCRWKLDNTHNLQNNTVISLRR
ncbi:unnamed protein product [Schistosoma intercalatum]|nr:unnamed protein product [Schistosoma intercalatum]CAH8549076.1 unnamed protein product [Schistosoma intercalatum]